MTTVVWQRLEGTVVFLAALVIYLYMDDGISWWQAVLLFFVPDISFAGYALGPRFGAAAYNLMHVYALGAVLIAAGMVSGVMAVAALGALWLAHSGFDRMLGYGLKSPEGFTFTHLGEIGHKSGQ